MNDNHIVFVIFAKKDDKTFYISNTEPFIWSPNIENAKSYVSRVSAEYEVIKNNQNYISLYNQIQSHTIDSVYVARIVNNIEMERYRLL